MTRPQAASVNIEFGRQKNRALTPWRAVAYLAVFLPYFFIVASFWMFPEFAKVQPADWRPMLVLAEASVKEGDLYSARSLYSRTARIASWSEDWVGLLAAACGIKKLDGRRASDSATHTILVRAMIAAEVKQDQAGLSAVADAFESMGEHNAADMVLSRMRHDRPGPSIEAAAGLTERDCWGAGSIHSSNRASNVEPDE